MHYAVNLYLIFCLALNFNVKEIKIRCVLNIILQKKKNALIACLTILLLYFQLFFSYLKLNGSMFKNKIDFKMAKLYA